MKGTIKKYLGKGEHQDVGKFEATKTTYTLTLLPGYEFDLTQNTFSNGQPQIMKVIPKAETKSE